ncbi:MAG TPA: capsular polysaccharide synthesis protein [Dongiaceae bacterium]|nr:capsular polysaccharide synthesis protein [Dongiaceae bacterium]
MALTNRTIWTFWHQGFDQAPPLVQVAHPSWRRLNPGWRVVALDRHSISDWIDLASVIDLRRRDLTLQKLADIARLCLLRRYGGVWVDATVYCCGPLDLWLPKACDTGFFAYRNPGPDRLISSWMIAAEPDNPILVAFHDCFLRLWQANRFSNHDTRFGKWAVEELSVHLNKDPRRTTCWLAPAILRTIRAYPYYLFHYTFNKVILSDPELRRPAFAGVTKVSGCLPSTPAFAC